MGHGLSHLNIVETSDIKTEKIIEFKDNSPDISWNWSMSLEIFYTLKDDLKIAKHSNYDIIVTLWGTSIICDSIFEKYIAILKSNSQSIIV